MRIDINARTPSDQLQQQLDQAAGGELVVEGRISCSAPLLIGSNTRAWGVGTGSGFAFDFLKWSSPEPFYFGNRRRKNGGEGDENITLENLGFFGAGTGEPLGKEIKEFCNGLKFRKVIGLKLLHCRVENIPLMGIVFNGCDRLTVENNTVRGTGRDGINAAALIDQVNANPLVIASFCHNEISQTGDDGIAVYSAVANAANLTVQPTGIDISHNHIRIRETPHRLAQGRGIVGCGIGGVIDSNLIEDTPSNAICLYRQHERTFCTSGIVVSNNRCSKPGQCQGELKRSIDGIYVKDGTSYFTLTGNIVDDPAGHGINVVDSRDGSIQSNVINKRKSRFFCIRLAKCNYVAEGGNTLQSEDANMVQVVPAAEVKQ